MTSEAERGPVLVTGPDDTAVEFITALLERADIDVVGAPARRAAAAVLEHRPALVLVDHDLGVLRSIRNLADPRRAAVPTLLLGPIDGDEPDEDDALAAGADHHLARPVAEGDLLDRIRTILDAD